VVQRNPDPETTLLQYLRDTCTQVYCFVFCHCRVVI